MEFQWSDESAKAFLAWQTGQCFTMFTPYEKRIEKFKKEFSKPKYPEGIESFIDQDNVTIRPMVYFSCYECVVDEHIKRGRKIHSVKNSIGETLYIGNETDFGKIIKFDIVVEASEPVGSNIIYSPPKLVVYCSERDMVYLPIDRVTLKKESPINKYHVDLADFKMFPKGIVAFSSSLSFKDWKDFFKGDIGYQTYEDWVREHLSVNRNILSVKNNSDEVLTIGDETNFGKIVSFKFSLDKIWCHTDGTVNMGIAPNINQVHPLSKGIVTHDGFAVYEHDGLWALDLNDFKFAFYEDVLQISKSPRKLFFKERSNCEKYIEQNEPKFSKKQMEDSLQSLKDTEALGGKIENAIRNFKTSLGL